MSKTVLLVEDEDAIRKSCGRIVEEAGMTVISCAGATEAIRSIEDATLTIDILLSDVVMPGGIDGFELAERMKKARKHAAIILMSGYAAEVVRKYGTVPEGMGFLEKPFDKERLLDKLFETYPCEQ